MNNILIVVDMQNDFIDGSLGTKEAQEIVPAAVERIKKAKQDNWRILYTMDTHFKNYLSTNEGKHLPVVHCIYNEEGHNLNKDISSELSGYPSCLYEKGSFACIDLAEDLAFETDADNNEADTNIELIGLCTDVCVISNALLLKAYLPEANISVNASCCAGITPEKHDAAIEVMRSCHIDIV